jgi:hypothetical protein
MLIFTRRILCFMPLLIVLAFAVVPTSASASWGWSWEKGEHCSQGNNHHCYALSEWIMKGSEQVEGSLAYQWTESMNVPGWESGAFIDNEEWVSFQSTGYWVEVGQTAGEDMDCCSLHSFYAWDNASGYSQYVAPWTVGANEWKLYQVSGQNHNGTWCLYFGSTQVRCPTGFSDYSDELQVGAEYATETEPSNTGHEETNGWWGDKEYNWLKEHAYADEGTCLERYGSPPELGNIAFWTC